MQQKLFSSPMGSLCHTPGVVRRERGSPKPRLSLFVKILVKLLQLHVFSQNFEHRKM